MLNASKLFQRLAKDESLRDISVMDIVKVAVAVLEAINSGECFDNLSDAKE